MAFRLSERNADNRHLANALVVDNVERFSLGGAAPGRRSQGYGRLMALARLETFAIEAFRPAGAIRDANQALPCCRQVRI